MRKIPSFNLSDVTSPEIDKVSQDIVRSVGGAGSKIPVKSNSDGNCLFNAVSFAICGSQRHSRDLRFWTCVELGLNFQRYEHAVGSKLEAVSPPTLKLLSTVRIQGISAVPGSWQHWRTSSSETSSVYIQELTGPWTRQLGC